MNISDIKSPVTERGQRAEPDKALRAKLQEQGLQQAARFQETQVSLSSASTNAQIGVKVLSAAFGQTLVIGQDKIGSEPSQKANESLFDFEEIAKNVLNFVGGVLKSAKSSGVDDEQLLSMFEQATSGVAKGIEDARKQLAGFMTDDIDQGIKQSEALIGAGIEQLRAEIFGTDEQDPRAVDSAAIAVGYNSERAGELHITTKEGDRVKITFANLQGLRYEETQNNSRLANDKTPDDKHDSENVDDNTNSVADEQPSSATVSSLNIFQSNGLSLEVEGELDEDELTALASLVGDIKSVAESFFQKDLEGAFQKALEIGFDENELSGYAFQLSQKEQLQVVKTYSEVAQFGDSDPQLSNSSRALLAPVGEYMADLMSVLESANSALMNKQQFDGILRELLDKSVEHDAKSADEAHQRFSQFNEKLLQPHPNRQGFAG